MPGTPHEVVLLAIREDPGLFAEVLRRVVGTDLPGPIEVMDSNVRFAASRAAAAMGPKPTTSPRARSS